MVGIVKGTMDDAPKITHNRDMCLNVIAGRAEVIIIPHENHDVVGFQFGFRREADTR